MDSLIDATEIAYFFVPLPQALALPDKFTFAFDRAEPFEAYVERLRRADARDDVHVDPPQQFLTASLRFWHSSVAGSDFDVIEQLFAVAHRALPQLAQTHGKERERDATPTTVVEMAVPVPPGADDPVSTAFDEGIRVLRSFQRAYHLVRKSPLTLVTRQRLPAMIPYAVRDLSGKSDAWPTELQLMQLSWNVTPLTREAALTAAQLRDLPIVMNMQPNQRVFGAYADLRRDGIRYVRMEGDYRAAVLFCAAASEVLFDDFLTHMLWEEAVRPEEAAVLFEGWLQTRIKRCYHARLGGTGWSLATPGPLADWNQHIAQRRHRVIHAGYEPSSDEASRALDALLSLESFLGERVLSARPLSKYPRTALAFFGRPELERRGKWNSHLEALIDDRSETDWGETFLRWNDAMQRMRTERPPDCVDPSVDEAVVVAVVHPQRTLVWVLHHGEAHMALRAVQPHVITTEQSAAVEAFVKERPVDGPAVSLALFDARAEPLADASWVPEYRLLPLGGVMVTGADLDAPEMD